MADTDLVQKAPLRGIERPPSGFAAELVALVGCSLLMLALMGLAALLESFAP